jgi:predicted metalloprotease with PDZ domain
MDPIRYTIRFDQAANHYIEVDAVYPADGASAIDLMMAVWTPGSYLVRDYSGKVESLVARSPAGDPLDIEHPRKNRWRIATGGAAQVRLAYRIYCREMSVRSNWVERDFAILNGAATFITLVDPATDTHAVAAHEVALELPPGWPSSHSSLSRGAGDRYRAEDFDQLVDSPILAGDLAVYPFSIDGVEHFLVNLGEGGVWDGARSAADVETLTTEQIRFWGEIPYSSYSFLNAVTEGRGGLEHKASTLLMTSRWATRTRESYVKWLKLVSHEFFHTWNVKRLRPAALGPFDYERENHTSSLWIAEGFTSYYESVLLRRAGLIDDTELLEAVSEDIRDLQTAPARLVQPVGESSFDAWTKAYRRDENAPNSVVNYYAKGAVIALLLDAKIRKLSDGARSLDDVMREAYRRYSGEQGYTPDQFAALISEIAAHDLSAWLGEAVDGSAELDYNDLLAWYGLRFKAKEKKEGEDKPPAAWIGAKTELREGRLIVTEVRRETPAHTAGINVEDEILAIGDYRITAGKLDERLERYRPGDQLSLLVSRREKLMRIPIVSAETPSQTWTLEIDPDAPDSANQQRQAWLSGKP